jgi:DNA integrity scanning protein DisA with diadenylate cyclase activity
MMSQTITLNLPDQFYKRIKRIAQTMAQPIESVLLKVLQSSLEQIVQLTQLETWDNSAFKQLLLKTVPKEQQQELESLLHKNKSNSLNNQEQKRLAILQDVVNKIMLQKALAAVLLRFRGQRLPTLAELRQLTTASQ